MKARPLALLDTHLSSMNGLSRQKWPPIVERDGFEIIEDRAYQGFDEGHHPWWTEQRFWCRSITVRRISDGRTGCGVGPQADAYTAAVSQIEKRMTWRVIHRKGVI